MDKNQHQPNKCYCARCFMPIDAGDKVDIEGQNYHRLCSTCCICRQVPTSLKSFYGHVFCQECFKQHVLKRFRGESPSVQCNRRWMQWAPSPAPATHQPSNYETKKYESSASKKNETKIGQTKDKSSRKRFCSRCLQTIEGEKVEIDGQCFHEKCAKCCRCRRVPTTSPKIYNGKVFCTDCYRIVMNLNRNPAEFFREWKNPQIAANMNKCMAGNTAACFMMMQHGGPFCGRGPCAGAGSGASSVVGAGGGGWPTNERDKCDFRPLSGLHTALPAPRGPGGGDAKHPPAAPAAATRTNWDFALDTLEGTADIDPQMQYSAVDGSVTDETMELTEKIEKLTKLLKRDNSQYSKKWKHFDMEDFQDPISYGWVDIQERIKNKSKVNLQRRPQSLWQFGILNNY